MRTWMVKLTEDKTVSIVADTLEVKDGDLTFYRDTVPTWGFAKGTWVEFRLNGEEPLSTMTYEWESRDLRSELKVYGLKDFIEDYKG